ncbi:Fe-S cluster assembly protein SufD [Cognatilysobacter terrigena]|uniref:Fe-S cluster assembly protein SufD n=1 Tax=Cognatilysobacter terrigena TaxID=2488749 RepID=UPI00105B5595|nr:Fe-S cluster assembly protein SufD [Lysobacter terrigena]
MSALLDSLTAAFDTLPLREAGGLGPARREALDALRRDGLPGPRVEAWKYTSLRPLERRTFAAANEGLAFDAAWVASIPSPRIAFVNGRFAAELSDLSTLGAGVTVEPLSAVLARGDSRECNILARRFDRADEPFARLNAALAVDGAAVHVDAGVHATRALHVVAIGAPMGSDVASHLRHLFDLREGARLEVVEHVIASAPHANLTTSVAHAHLKPDAHLVHARLQDDAEGAQLFARTDAVLARDAIYRRLDLELGAGLSRHELNVALHGDRACANANGVLLGSGRRHLDTRLGLDHVGRDGRCDLVWRGLASGRARVAFHGGIEIREGADGTQAALSNKNLLLSDAAEIDSQPVLVIHADEVQAAHGATVGQLDPTSLFYLRSRGIPANEARAMLTAAFCRETLAVLDDGATRDLLAARLDAALARMETP